MRPAEAIQVTRMYMEAVKAFGTAEESKGGDNWTEDDDGEFADLIKEIEAEGDSEEGSDELAEPDDSEGS